MKLKALLQEILSTSINEFGTFDSDLFAKHPRFFLFLTLLKEASFFDLSLEFKDCSDEFKLFKNSIGLLQNLIKKEDEEYIFGKTIEVENIGAGARLDADKIIYYDEDGARQVINLSGEIEEDSLTETLNIKIIECNNLDTKEIEKFIITDGIIEDGFLNKKGEHAIYLAEEKIIIYQDDTGSEVRVALEGEIEVTDNVSLIFTKIIKATNLATEKKEIFKISEGVLRVEKEVDNKLEFFRKLAACFPKVKNFEELILSNEPEDLAYLVKNHFNKLIKLSISDIINISDRRNQTIFFHLIQGYQDTKYDASQRERILSFIKSVIYNLEQIDKITCQNYIELANIEGKKFYEIPVGFTKERANEILDFYKYNIKGKSGSEIIRDDLTKTDTHLASVSITSNNALKKIYQIAKESWEREGFNHIEEVTNFANSTLTIFLTRKLGFYAQKIDQLAAIEPVNEKKIRELEIERDLIILKVEKIKYVLLNYVVTGLDYSFSPYFSGYKVEMTEKLICGLSFQEILGAYYFIARAPEEQLTEAFRGEENKDAVIEQLLNGQWDSLRGHLEDNNIDNPKVTYLYNRCYFGTINSLAMLGLNSLVQGVEIKVINTQTVADEIAKEVSKLFIASLSEENLTKLKMDLKKEVQAKNALLLNLESEEKTSGSIEDLERYSQEIIDLKNEISGINHFLANPDVPEIYEDKDLHIFALESWRVNGNIGDSIKSLFRSWVNHDKESAKLTAFSMQCPFLIVREFENARKYSDAINFSQVIEVLQRSIKMSKDLESEIDKIGDLESKTLDWWQKSIEMKCLNCFVRVPGKKVQFYVNYLFEKYAHSPELRDSFAAFINVNIQNQRVILKHLPFISDQNIFDLLPFLSVESIEYVFLFEVWCNKRFKILYRIMDYVDLGKERLNMVLIPAAEYDDLETVKLLLEKGADINFYARNAHGGSNALHHAVRNENLEMIKFLLSKGIDFSFKNNKYMTPIECAIQSCKKDIIKILLMVETDKKMLNKVLLWAASSSNASILVLALEKGADINSKSSDFYNTALHYAVDNSDLALVRLLLENKAKSYANFSGAYPIEMAIKKNDRKIILYLLWAETNRESLNRVLIYAANIGDIDIVKLALEKGADIDYCDPLSWGNALNLAVEQGSLELVNFLLSKNASTSIRNNFLKTAIEIAIASKNFDIIKSLLEVETNKEVLNMVLLWSVHQCKMDILKLVLKKGADINYGNSYFSRINTALELAITKENQFMIRFLIKKGFAINGCNYRHIFNLLLRKNYLDIIHYVIERQKDSSNLDFFLYWAAEMNNEDFVRLLLAKGADINYKDSVYEDTVLHWAVRNENPRIIKLALYSGADIASVNEEGYTPFEMTRSLDLVIPFIEKETDHIQLSRVIFNAIKNDRTKLAEYLLQKHEYVDLREVASGNTALHFAAKNGNSEILKLLLSRGLLPTENNDFDSPLNLAIKNWRPEAIKLLVKTENNCRVLSYLIMKVANIGELEVISLALERRKELQFSIENGKEIPKDTILKEELVQAILEENFNPKILYLNIQRAVKMRLVFYQNNLLEKMRLSDLIVENQTPFHNALLVEAAENGNREILELLLKEPNKIYEGNVNLLPALLGAMKKNNYEIAKYLLKKLTIIEKPIKKKGAIIPDKIPLSNANKKYKQEIINYALIWSAENGYLDIANIALREGANINTRLPNGNTSLHLAASNRHKEIVCFLLENGANSRIKNTNKMTALDIAKKAKYSVIENILRIDSVIIDSLKKIPYSKDLEFTQNLVIDVFRRQNISIKRKSKVQMSYIKEIAIAINAPQKRNIIEKIKFLVLKVIYFITCQKKRIFSEDSKKKLKLNIYGMINKTYLNKLNIYGLMNKPFFNKGLTEKKHDLPPTIPVLTNEYSTYKLLSTFTPSLKENFRGAALA